MDKNKGKLECTNGVINYWRLGTMLVSFEILLMCLALPQNLRVFNGFYPNKLGREKLQKNHHWGFFAWRHACT